MAPHRVIEDSDEDGASFGSPDSASPSAAMQGVGVVPMMQLSSTDPILFRAVYEEHLGQLLVDDQLPDHGQTPIFEDAIIDQRMSSSASMPSAQKLKRSKTINLSSLSSITEPTLSDWKAKRTDSMRGIDDLTQITTPKKPKNTIRRDPWEVPTSSASDGPLDSCTKVTSRNAERKHSLKTYGRQIRRTQTVGHIASNFSTDPRLLSPLKREMPQTVNQNTFVQNEEDDDLPISRRKRHKLGPSMAVKSHEPFQAEPTETIPEDVRPLSGDITSTDIRSVSIEVQRSASLHTDMGTKHITTVNAHDFSSLHSPTRTSPDSTVEDSYLLTKSSAAQSSRKPLRSITIVPDTLSDEQKLQYEIVSVASTSRSRQSSPSAIRETVNPEILHASLGMVSSDASLPELTSRISEEMAPIILPSSSPPVSAPSRKTKRASSEMLWKQVPTLGTIGHHSRVVKRRGRSKTIAQGERPPSREASIDELSLTSVEPMGKRVLREASARSRKKEAYCEDEHEIVTTDELQSSDETGLEGKRYQSHPCHRRAKSMSMNPPHDDADLGLPRQELGRKKKTSTSLDKHNEFTPKRVNLPTEISHRAPIIQDVSAVATFSAETIAENSVQATESSSRASAKNSTDVSIIETVPAVSTQPKKRGRKKTSETVAVSGFSKTLSTGSVLVVPEANGIHRKALREMDRNEQLSQEIASTPPTETRVGIATDELPPAQTPSKNTKHRPDQHSPLQSGKVPYRVGLSKKTRIAPLLKMIRK